MTTIPFEEEALFKRTEGRHRKNSEIQSHIIDNFYFNRM